MLNIAYAFRNRFIAQGMCTIWPLDCHKYSIVHGVVKRTYNYKRRNYP